MAKHEVVFDGETEKIFMTNYRRDAEYNASIINETDQNMTFEVSNQSSNRGEIPIWEDPGSGATTINIGADFIFSEPHVQWRFTAGVPATGSIYIVEAG